MNQCKVCGHTYDNFYPWGKDGKMASFEICDCCGVTFGHEDATDKAIRNFREGWLNSGAMWNNKELGPPNWSKNAALKLIKRPKTNLEKLSL